MIVLEPDHAMLDLETLGTDPFAPVLSIGACAMRLDDESPIDDTFYVAIKLDSSMSMGLRPSPSTIRWWMTDPSITPEARDRAFNDAEALSLPNALDEFTTWLNSRPLYLWGNSARFDCGLLEACYKACSKEVPWMHWMERDYRTIKNLQLAKGIKLNRVGTFHNALDDAISQAYHLRAINKQLQLGY